MFLGQYGAGDVFTQITAEQVTQRLALLQLVGHFVKILAQQSELVFTPHVHAHIQIALGHGPGALNQTPQWLADTAGHHPGHQRNHHKRNHKNNTGSHQHPVFHHGEPLGFDVHTHQSDGFALSGSQRGVGRQGITELIPIGDVFHRRAGKPLQHNGRIFRRIELAGISDHLAFGVVNEKEQLGGDIGGTQNINGVYVLVTLRHGFELLVDFLVKRCQRGGFEVVGGDLIGVDGGSQAGG